MARRVTGARRYVLEECKGDRGRDPDYPTRRPFASIRCDFRSVLANRRNSMPRMTPCLRMNWNGGAAAIRFLGCARMPRGPRGQPIVRLHQFRYSWPTKETHPRALIMGSEGLLRSEAERVTPSGGP